MELEGKLFGEGWEYRAEERVDKELKWKMYEKVI